MTTNKFGAEGYVPASLYPTHMVAPSISTKIPLSGAGYIVPNDTPTLYPGHQLPGWMTHPAPPPPQADIHPLVMRRLEEMYEMIHRLVVAAESNTTDSLEKKVEDVIKGVLDNKVAPSQVDDLKQATEKNVRDRSLRRAIRPI